MKHIQNNLVIILVLITFFMSACGGGGGGGNPPPNTNNNPGGGGGALYSVGGSVSGLTGAGLVLQNNAAGNLNISNNGNFSFTTSLIDGAGYSVTVATLPAGQNCTVNNGTGTVNGANVTNVEVVCVDITGGWGSAVRVGGNNAGNANKPQVAIDASGNAIAIWLENDGTSNNLLASRYTKGVGWGASTFISDDSNDENVDIPYLAMDDDGDAIVVWRQHDVGATRYSLWAVRYDATGLNWGAPELMENDDTNSANYPRVAFNKATGDALIVWVQADPVAGGRFVWARDYSPLTGWGTAIVVEDTSGDSTDKPQVAINDSGDAIVVWQTTSFSIRAITYNSMSGWGTPQDIKGVNLVHGQNPQVVIDEDGNAIVVWEDGVNGGLFSIWANRYTAGSGWGTPEVLEPYENDYASAPQIVMDVTGNATVAWRQPADTNQERVVANRYTMGAGWGTAQIISDVSLDHTAQAPQLSVDDSGNVIVLYHQTGDGLNDDIVAVHYEPGLGWLTPEVVDSYTQQILYDVDVAVNPNGEAVAIWSQRNDSTLRFDVWASNYQ